MSVYSEVFSIDSLNLNSSFRISFKKNKPEPPSDTYTVFFVNNDYPNVLIPLPESRTVSPGSYITLPEVQGTYEDQDNYYVPQSWSIGNFNEEIIVNSNLEANLILSVTPKTTTYTIVFTNTTYPQFAVNIPEDMIVEEGNSVALPSTEGTFEDEENIYTPQKWSIGDFGETITPTSSMTANLLWNVQQKIVTYTVSFVNTQLPDIQIDMPQSETGEAGTAITLPTMTGEYEYDGKMYQPTSWDIGDFGSTYTITSDVEAHLVFEEVSLLPTVTLATYYTGNYGESCSPGSFLNLYENAKLVPYDSTKTHIARVSDGHGGWNEWQFSCIEYAGDIAVKNMSSDTLDTYAVRLFSCSSTQAEIVYVYNLSNEKYQAFRFTLNGSYYYYVADNVQNDWTDDLSSIGYSLEQITYTLSFTNTTYPDFAVSLPQAITENAGTEITLPSVSGSFEDEDYIYTPSAWSIGEFESKFILNNNINANLVWKSEEKQPSFVSDRFIDVTTKALALNPIPNYTPNGSFWIDNLSGRMPLSAYTTDTTQDYDFITSGYDDCASLSLNQSEIPTIIWLNAEAQYAPDSSVISALGLTDVINSEPEGSAMLRVITSISGGTLGNLTFGSITRVEYIKILYCDIVGYNEFGEDVMIRDDFGFSINFYRQSSVTITDTFNVPEEDRFLVEENNETYVAYKTLIPANTVHINGALYDKPLIAEYGENTGLVIYEPTPYDLSVPPTPPSPTVPIVNIYLNPKTSMYFQSNVTNRVKKQPGNMYQLYTDDTLQTPYIFDWGKRYEKGYINSETGEWVAPVRQNQSDLPAVKGDSIDSSFLANISDSASTIGMLWLLSTTSSSGYMRYGQITVKIYDDATSYWLNGNHTDQAATSTYLTDIDYDSSKIYKVLALVKENGNRDYDEYLYALNFYNNSGKLKIILSTYTSSMRFARIVLHAKNKEIYTGYFNAGDGNSEKSTTNVWAASGDQIDGIYPLNSDTGYQYRSAQYKILSVFYTDGTTVTDETLAPYSISSSVKMVSNPYVSGLLSIKTMVNNKILGHPCGCTFRMELTLYFNGNNPGVNTSLRGSTSDSIQWVRLYAQNTTGGSGTEVSYDPSKVYKVLGVYKEDGTQIESTFMMGNSSNYLRLCIINGGTEWIGAKVVYTEA
jgi:hypothetical protein